MLPFILRRLLQAIPILLAATFFSFVLVAMSGDPLEGLKINPRVSQEQIEAKEKELRLDKPLLQRYALWLGDAVTGDLGEDVHGNAVWPQLQRALSVTMRLVFGALILAVLLAVVVGVLSAVRQYSLFDYGTTTIAFLCFALPTFWLAVLMKEFGAIQSNDWLQNPGVSVFVLVVGTLLAGLVGLGLATLGRHRGDKRRAGIGAAIGGMTGFLFLLGAGWWLDGRSFSRWIATVFEQTPNFQGNFGERFLDYTGHIILPVLTLVLISFAQYSRFTRSSMLDTMSSDYVRTARAKGLREHRVVSKHALRNALIPLTTVVALDFAAVLGGAVITERVFQWGGMGTLLINAINDKDVYMMQAWLVITAIAVIVANLVADIIYAYLDPRIRLD